MLFPLHPHSACGPHLPLPHVKSIPLLPKHKPWQGVFTIYSSFARRINHDKVFLPVKHLQNKWLELVYISLCSGNMISIKEE